MMRATLILALLIGLCSPGSAAPPELAGRWSGYWISDTDGHNGPLHATFKPLDSQTYRVRFSGRFAKVIPFTYSTKLHVDGATDDTVLLSANQNLGPLLGKFQTSAMATATSFDAHFNSRKDAGRFVLNRTR